MIQRVSEQTACAHPKVSVAMITYNHERFIAQAIESVLAQKVDFEVEMVIGEDCSTDGTRRIVQEYARKYPNVIRALLPDKNVGMQKNFIIVIEACTGDFIACLESDDFWTDPQKLAKQAAFLDANLECASCFHNAIMFSDDQSNSSPDLSLNKRGNRLMCRPRTKPRYSQKDFFKGNVIPTCSVMFRKEAVGKFPPWFEKLSIADLPLHILCTEHGMAGYLRDVMAAYRLHSGSSWSSKSFLDKIPHEIEMFEELERYLQSRPKSVAIQASRRQAVLAISRCRRKLELGRARQWLDSSPEKVCDAIWRAWLTNPYEVKWLLRWLLCVWPRVLGGKFTASCVHRKLREKF
jgi:glycosyltransferase involved in cell wall biosynthesis